MLQCVAICDRNAPNSDTQKVVVFSRRAAPPPGGLTLGASDFASFHQLLEPVEVHMDLLSRGLAKERSERRTQETARRSVIHFDAHHCPAPARGTLETHRASRIDS